MNKLMKTLVSLSASVVLLTAGAALADTISFDGTVTAGATCEVTAPLGGMVERVDVKAGQTVKAGDVVAVLRTERTVATEAGTVTAVFGKTGDEAAAVVERYGAVMYIEGAVKYTVSTNISNAYNAIENNFLHAGQRVFLRGKNNTDHTGSGIITIVDGNSYTVEVLAGEFIVGESANLYMDEDMKDSSRIGRGTIARKSPKAVKVESGTLVNLAVKAGDTVKRGDLLFETLSGTCEPGDAASVIYAAVDGVVASVSAVQAQTVAEDAVIAVIYPVGAMRIEGSVPESDLASVQVGGTADITLTWNEDSAVTYPGTIAWISAIADEKAAGDESTEASYKVYVSFEPDENTRYGMNAEVEVK